MAIEFIPNSPNPPSGTMCSLRSDISRHKCNRCGHRTRLKRHGEVVRRPATGRHTACMLLPFKDAPRTVILAAHPDDEVIGASSLLPHLPGLVVVHATD